MAEVHTIFDKEKMDEAHARLSKQHIAKAASNVKKFDQPMPGTVNNLEEALHILMAMEETIKETVRKTACVLHREMARADITTRDVKSIMTEHETIAAQVRDAHQSVLKSAEALVRADRSIQESEKQ